MVMLEFLVKTKMRKDKYKQCLRLVYLWKDYLSINNQAKILKEWQELTTDCKADIKVLDMSLLDTTQYKDLLGTFISDLILQVLSFVAEQERKNIKTRQAEGIAVAKAKNVKFGRPAFVAPDNFEEEYKKWKSGKQTAVQTMKNTNTKKSTFYKFVKMYEEN